MSEAGSCPSMFYALVPTLHLLLFHLPALLSKRRVPLMVRLRLSTRKPRLHDGWVDSVGALHTGVTHIAHSFPVEIQNVTMCVCKKYVKYE